MECLCELKSCLHHMGGESALDTKTCEFNASIFYLFIYYYFIGLKPMFMFISRGDPARLGGFHHNLKGVL